jgi:Cys-tRNA(Pro)/Cys-tRNA(Cys) deacylase
MRLLDGKGVPYEVYTFSPDIHSALGVAESTGIPIENVYKTLVVVRLDGKPLLAICPGRCQVNLKKLAQAIGEKKLRMATQKEAEGLTGLQVGGISALALTRRGFPVYLDRSALSLEFIVVSAGCRGINLRLAVEDLIRVTGAVVPESTFSEEGRQI